MEEVNVIMYGDVKTIELIQPDGQKLEPEMIRSPSFVMIKLTDVMPGRWKLITTGIPGGQIRINMVYNSNMGIQVETEPDSLEIRPDETLRVKAWLTNPDGRSTARQNTGYTVQLVLMDPMDQEIERIDMQPVDDHFEAEKQFAEGSYQYQVVASGYGLERASEVFGPLIVDATHNNTERVTKMLLAGTVMLLAGWLLQYGIPCGKKMWSSTYVLITCGMAMCIQAMLIHFVDIKGNKSGWGRFFETFGVNPLALYLLGTVLAILFGAIPLGHNADGDTITIHSAVYNFYTTFSSECMASALYAISFVLLNWVVGHVLYSKKIFIKI